MINYLILMAGKGTRFSEAGYNVPKPFIPITDKLLMIELACHTLSSDKEQCRYIFVCQEEHKKYSLENVLNGIAAGNECHIIYLTSVTEGAVCSALTAKELINTDDELIIMNSDQVLDWSYSHFLSYIRRENADAAIPTFIPVEGDPKWSYAKLSDDKKTIVEVREKVEISASATAGVYYYKTGASFVEASEAMIAANDRVNNEFYVAPTYNYLSSSSNIINYPIAGMYGVGTPEDLEIFKKTRYYLQL